MTNYSVHCQMEGQHLNLLPAASASCLLLSVRVSALATVSCIFRFFLPTLQWSFTSDDFLQSFSGWESCFFQALQRRSGLLRPSTCRVSLCWSLLCVMSTSHWSVFGSLTYIESCHDCFSTSTYLSNPPIAQDFTSTCSLLVRTALNMPAHSLNCLRTLPLIVPKITVLCNPVFYIILYRCLLWTVVLLFHIWGLRWWCNVFWSFFLIMLCALIESKETFTRYNKAIKRTRRMYCYMRGVCYTLLWWCNTFKRDDESMRLSHAATATLPFTNTKAEIRGLMFPFVTQDTWLHCVFLPVCAPTIDTADNCRCAESTFTLSVVSFVLRWPIQKGLKCAIVGYKTKHVTTLIRINVYLKKNRAWKIFTLTVNNKLCCNVCLVCGNIVHTLKLSQLHYFVSRWNINIKMIFKNFKALSCVLHINNILRTTEKSFWPQ